MTDTKWTISAKCSDEIVAGKFTLPFSDSELSFEIDHDRLELCLPEPSEDQLKDYPLRGGVTLEKALCVPVFAPPGYASRPMLEYESGGKSVRIQAIVSTNPVAMSGAPDGGFGKTIHYFVFATRKLTYKHQLIMTEVDITFVPGWNVIYCEGEIMGHKVQAARSFLLWPHLREAPDGYWCPEVTIL